MGISIDEKRVYDASEGPTPVYVVGEFGVARVDTSDDLVGEFGLAHECSARDAAGQDGRVAVATDEDVLVGVAGDAGEEQDESSGKSTDFEPLEVGPAVAVGYTADGHLIVAREDGTILRGAGGDDGTSWTELGDLADVRAIDGDFVAAESGVYRATGIAQSATKTADGGASSAGLHHVGLDDARDVSTAGVPLAATGDGLYRLGNGWMKERDGDFRAVSATNGKTPGLGWAHAAGESGLLVHEDGGERTDGEGEQSEPERRQTTSAGSSRASSDGQSDGDWREADLPVAGEVVAVDHGEEYGVYAVTDDGTFLLSVGDGWNHQILGLRGVTAVAAP